MLTVLPVITHATQILRPMDTHTLTYRANPLGINFFIQRVCMPGLAGVPVARGAPHAAMLCQQTALMPSICSVTYIKCMLLSLTPQ